MRIRTQRLPIGYRELEYLESSGTQYINTGVNASSSLGLHYRIIDKSGRFGVLGADDSKRHHSYDSSSLYGYASGGYGVGAINDIIEVRVNWLNDKKIYGHTSTYENTWNLSTTTFDTSMTYILFARGYRSQGTINPYWSGRIYYFKMSVSTEIVRNFIPAERYSDGKPGLYDTVNNVFYVNQGTGEFIKGPYKDSYRVNLYPRLPSDYQEVEYIQANDISNIDSGVVPAGTTKVQLKFRTNSTPYYFFGTRANTSTTPSTTYENINWRIFVYNNQFYGDLGDGNIQSSGNHRIIGGSASANTIYELEYGNHYIKNLSNGSIIAEGSPVNNVNYTSTYTLGVFKEPLNQSNAISGCRLYYCKIYDNNVLVRDFIPCYRKSDNVIGLYDLVEGTFYTNSGTGTFTKGNNVNNIQRCLIAGGSSGITYGYNQYVRSTVGSYYGNECAASYDKTTNSYTLTANSSTTHNYFGLSCTGLGKLKNHKVLCIAYVTNMSVSGNIDFTWGVTSRTDTGSTTTANKYVYCVGTWKSNVEQNYLNVSKSSGTFTVGDSFTVKDVMIIDLTDWFGEGKEPTTLAGFRQKFTQEYYPPQGAPLRLTQYQINNIGPAYGWNQITQYGDFSSTSGWKCTNGTVSIANGVGKFTCTTAGNLVAYRVHTLTSHKYFVKFDIRTSKSTNISNNWESSVYVSSTPTIAGEWKTVTGINTAVSPTIEQGHQWKTVAQNMAVGDYFELRNYWTVDLTDMFGAGNEPTTVKEFMDMFYKKYYPAQTTVVYRNKYAINALGTD